MLPTWSTTEIENWIIPSASFSSTSIVAVTMLSDIVMSALRESIVADADARILFVSSITVTISPVFARSESRVLSY